MRNEVCLPLESYKTIMGAALSSGTAGEVECIRWRRLTFLRSSHEENSFLREIMSDSIFETNRK